MAGRLSPSRKAAMITAKSKSSTGKADTSGVLREEGEDYGWDRSGYRRLCILLKRAGFGSPFLELSPKS